MLLNKIFDLVEDLINRFVRMRYEKKLLKEEKILNQITFDRKISISFLHYTSCFCEITDSEWIVFSSWIKKASCLSIGNVRAIRRSRRDWSVPIHPEKHFYRCRFCGARPRVALEQQKFLDVCCVFHWNFSINSPDI